MKKKGGKEKKAAPVIWEPTPSESGSQVSSDFFKFPTKEGTKVFCFHGPVMYVSRMVSSAVHHDVPWYKIHYVGWTDRHDEWVEEERLREFTPENQAEAKRLRQLAKGGQKRKSTGKAVVSKAKVDKPETTTASASKTPKPTAKEEPRETLPLNPNIKLEIPKQLKNILRYDYTKINKDNLVVQLPATKSVAEILEDYVTHRVDQEMSRLEHEEGKRKPPKDDSRSDLFGDNSPQLNATVYLELANQVTLYFNTVLSSKLLYNSPFERAQFDELKNKLQTDGTDEKENVKEAKVGKNLIAREIQPLLYRPPNDLTSVYGFTHLLRLFTLVPLLLSFQTPPMEGLTHSLEYFKDLLHYLNQQRDDLLGTVKYTAPTGDEDTE